MMAEFGRDVAGRGDSVEVSAMCRVGRRDAHWSARCRFGPLGPRFRFSGITCPKEVDTMETIERSSWSRSSVPPRHWSNETGRAHGIVELPAHLFWSGPSATFDLDDAAQLRVVYETVLREGSDADVCEWIHQPTLLTIWDTLWLPQSVHDAWDNWIRSHLSDVAV
jgi:hypothetical protein